MIYNTSVIKGFLLLIIKCIVSFNLGAQVERFMPAQGGIHEVWRLTHDPLVRDWANYHNRNAWSPDGRYLCYTHYAKNDKEFGTQEAAEIHLFDFHTGKDIKVDNGFSPRWANHNNWLFYMKTITRSDQISKSQNHVIWLDVDAGKLIKIAENVNTIDATDNRDRWVFGQTTSRQGVRVPIKPDSRPEILEGLTGIQWIGNPEYPVVFVRNDQKDSTGKPDFFKATRHWFDPEGDNITIGSPMIQKCHQSWSGDGKYLLHGNSLMRGRLWNEPFPSNLNILSSVKTGDISPCGKSGRWICGSDSYNSVLVSDLRSGDGINCIVPLSALSFPGTADVSGPYDNDAKGSPDGTKIVFVSNYDLKDGPLTNVTKAVSVSNEKIFVLSTAGFPESGRLLFQKGFRSEVVSYKSKSDTAFNRLKRGLYGTPLASLSKGDIVTSFDARVTSADKWKKQNLPLSADYMRESIDDPDSPLLRQHQTDIYVIVARQPDVPYFSKSERLELIPGENHWETFGYNIFKEGIKINDEPLQPGTKYELPGSGIYTATAVEYSGLESSHSLPLNYVDNIQTLYVRKDQPADFSWTFDRWIVNEQIVDKVRGKSSLESIREIVHLVDGIIHREWYNWGQITKRHDLNDQGKPIRRLFYRGGRLARREYHNKNAVHLSTEYFDAAGFITETILYEYNNGEKNEKTHWWYDKGMPVKLIGAGGYAVGPPGHYEKEGNKWVRKN